MIIETIIVLVLLGSLTGMIMFARHFLKHKKHVDKRKRKNNVVYSNFSIGDSLIEFFLRHSLKIAFICFLLIFINLVFQPFSQHTQTATPIPTPVPLHTNGPAINGTGNPFNEAFGSIFADGQVPWWFYALIFGIPIWIAWRFFRRAGIA